MAIANVAVGTKVTAAKGNEIINAVNAQRVDHDALNDLVHARTDGIGARNGHTTNPGQTISNLGACQFDVEGFRSGITAAEDFSGWTTITAGVYAISWGVNITLAAGVGASYLVVGTTKRMQAPFVEANWSYGDWVGYIPAGQGIAVRYTGPGPTPYIGGFIDIFRVGIGG